MLKIAEAWKKKCELWMFTCQLFSWKWCWKMPQVGVALVSPWPKSRSYVDLRFYPHAQATKLCDCGRPCSEKDWKYGRVRWRTSEGWRKILTAPRTITAWHICAKERCRTRFVHSRKASVLDQCPFLWQIHRQATVTIVQSHRHNIYWRWPCDEVISWN